MSELLRRLRANQKKIDELRPFEGPRLSQVRDFYRVAASWSSTSIEGFSYTELETKVLLEDGLTAGGKPLKDALAVWRHAEAYDRMFTLLKKRGLTEKDILTFHALLEGSLNNDSIAGAYRKMPVWISGSDRIFPPPGEVPGLMKRLVKAAAQKRGELYPVEFAAWLHLELVSIHPFADGNGRVGRLVMNTALIQAGFLPTIVPPVLRHEYYAALRLADHTGRQQPFLDFIGQCELETQKEFLRHMGQKAKT